jgi:hypothetical protein
MLLACRGLNVLPDARVFIPRLPGGLRLIPCFPLFFLFTNHITVIDSLLPHPHASPGHMTQASRRRHVAARHTSSLQSPYAASAGSYSPVVSGHQEANHCSNVYGNWVLY